MFKGRKWKEAAELKRIAICDDEIGTCSDLEKILRTAGLCRWKRKSFIPGRRFTVPYKSSACMIFCLHGNVRGF